MRALDAMIMERIAGVQSDGVDATALLNSGEVKNVYTLNKKAVAAMVKNRLELIMSGTEAKKLNVIGPVPVPQPKVDSVWTGRGDFFNQEWCKNSNLCEVIVNNDTLMIRKR